MRIRETNLSFASFVLLLIGMGSIVVTVLGGRNIAEGEMFDISNVGEGAVSFAASRLGTFLIILLCLFPVLRMAFRARVPRAGIKLWLSYLLFFLLAILSPSLVGEFNGSHIRLFYPPIIITAVFLSKPYSYEQLLVVTKAVLLAFVYGSLLAAIVAPSFALLNGYESFIPGIQFRLFGVASHANGLGPLVATFIIIELVNKNIGSKMRIINLGSAMVVLILSQSKTAWSFLLLGSLILCLKSIAYRLFSQGGRNGGMGRAVVYSLGGIVALGVTLFWSNVISLSSDSVYASVSTLSGRTEIWIRSIEEWRQNPLFGYGLGLWDAEFRARNQMLFVGHSHNQLIHTLSSAGLIGIVGLLVYLCVLVSESARAADTSLVPVIVLGMILVDCVSEVPFRDDGVFDVFFLLHLLLFVHLSHIARSKLENRLVLAPVDRSVKRSAVF
jgi:O-antigen ligase